MITKRQYLRRALLAPILVPLLAAIPWCRNLIAGKATATGIGDLEMVVVGFLLTSLCVGGIPYLWMLWDKREEWQRGTAFDLVGTWQSLPLGMLPYFFKFWGVLTGLLVFTGSGVFVGLGCLVFGAIAVPTLGWVYMGITFATLRCFQWLGAIERDIPYTYK